MSNAITKEAVQISLDKKKEERIFHIQDMEAVSVIDGKHDRERKAQAENQRQIRERFEAEQRRIQQREEERRIQEEEHRAEMAENRRDFRKAVILAGILCGFGGLNLIFAWRPEFAVVAGGVLILAGVSTIVFCAAALFRT